VLAAQLLGLGRKLARAAGEVTTLVSSLGTGVVFDAWAEADVYPYERGDARAMVARGGALNGGAGGRGAGRSGSRRDGTGPWLDL
jgi:hypothetical protein